MKIPVIKKTYIKDVPADDYWDHAFIDDVFSQRLWKPVGGYEFENMEFEELMDWKNTIGTSALCGKPYPRGAIIVIPARQHKDYEEVINRDINKLKWCILMLTGDEENDFDISKIKHPNCLIYQMTPHVGSRADRFLINGYAPEAKNLKVREKTLNFYFAGQVTHARRKEAIKAMRELEGGLLIETPGFTQGEKPKKYFEKLSQAKIAPCPGGAVIPDTFRLYEALEAGCLPIVDEFAPQQTEKGYWDFLFNEKPPFPLIENWQDLKGLVQYFLDTYPQKNNEVFAWWQMYKRNFVYQLGSDIRQLSGYRQDINTIDDITILMPTSPIKDHPDTSRIEETIKTVRDRLPNAEIIIMLDGVRPEQQEYTERYQEYTRRILNKCNYEWKNVLPVVFKEHYHQAAMTKQCLSYVKTNTIMFVEHDAPLCEEIPFSNIIRFVKSGEANVVRLLHEALILPVYKPMMLDEVPQDKFGIKVVRTAQWSQRPHVASTEFYRKMIDKYFTDYSRTMIEDRIHGVVDSAYQGGGVPGWDKWRVWIYAPDGDKKRSYHIDGRGADPKFDMIY